MTSITPAHLEYAVPAAMGAALSFGATAVLQHRANKLVPDRGALRLGTLFDLIRQPLWLGSVSTNIAGIVLQIVALRFGPLVLVQPLLVMGLFFAVLVGSLMQRSAPDRVILLGATLCVLGLTCFLVVAHPGGGTGQLDGSAALPLVIGLGVIVAGCLASSATSQGTRRAMSLALATGVLYGVIAGLIKVVVEQSQLGLSEPLHHWTIYVVIVGGPMAFLLNQNAYQAEPIAAPALAVITTADPLVGIGIGLLWLGESINAAIWAVPLEVLSLAAMVWGIAALAQRAPHVGSPADADPSPAGADPSPPHPAAAG